MVAFGRETTTSLRALLSLRCLCEEIVDWRMVEIVALVIPLRFNADAVRFERVSTDESASLLSGALVFQLDRARRCHNCGHVLEWASAVDSYLEVLTEHNIKANSIPRFGHD